MYVDYITFTKNANSLKLIQILRKTWGALLILACQFTKKGPFLDPKLYYSDGNLVKVKVKKHPNKEKPVWK